MPIKRFPSQLRLISSPLPLTRFATMKFGAPSVQTSSRSVSTFSKLFPYKLKYLGIGFPVSKQQHFGLRKLSSRPFKTRPGSEFGSSRGMNEIRATKSLVDDEAELSDWVSELGTDSYRGKLTSESDSDADRGFKGGDKGKSRGRDELRKGRESESDSGRFRSGGNRDWDYGRREGGLKRGRENEFGSGRFGSGGNREGSYGRRDGLKRGRDSDSMGMTSKSDRRSSFDSVSRRESSEPVDKRQFERSPNSGNGKLYSRGRNNGGSGSGSLSPVMNRGGSLKDIFYTKRKGSYRGASIVSNEESEDDDEDGDEKDSLSSFRQLLSEEDESEDGSEDDKEDYDELVMKASSSLGLKRDDGEKVLPRSPAGDSKSYLSETRFDQCSISPLSLKGVKGAGYEKMTVVQEATLPVILKGKDVLAKAKTGTGKTVAFLLPSIEVVVKSSSVGRDQKRPPILVLVICPTRELASQAAAEANTLLKFHPSIGVQVVIGGTRLALEQKRMQANPCQILVATPGRLRDHIENTAGFATRLMGVKVLVLDEADHLLDMGFRKDIEKIIAAVPKDRQTLLFSATVPDEVRQICHIALKRDHEFINTVQEGSEDTHSQVRQMHLVAPLDKHFSSLYALLKEHISDDVDYKVLVFCTTAMVTKLVANLLGELNLNVREIHSRKSQSVRTKVSDEFRKSKGLILVTSDVSARGVDYPDVTLVIQMGLPSDRQQYIHRLGRTGRKGKQGQGILLLAPWEEYFLSSIKDLPITKAPVPSVDPDTKKKVERALSQVELKNKEAAYQAWLGFYNSVKNVGRDKHRLVELANEFSRTMGLDNPPAIPKLILGKMGLKNIPGLRSK